MMNGPLSLVHILERARRYFPNSIIASRLPDRSFLHRCSYADLYRRSRALASALTRRGLKKGEVVATLMGSHYAHMEAYFGIPVAGAVVHTLNPRLHVNEIAYVANHAEDRFLIVDDTLLPLLEQIRDRVHFEAIFVFSLNGYPTPPGYEDYEELLASGDPDFTYPDIDENDAAAMSYTSGTSTGRPSGVVFSHRSIVLTCLGILAADSLGVVCADVVMPLVPMFHVLSWTLPYAAVMAGSKLVLPTGHWETERLVELLEIEKVTLGTGVPTVWLAVLQLLELKKRNYKFANGLRLFVGGAAAPEVMIRGFDRQGIPLIPAWGMTETSSNIVVCRLKPHLHTLPEEQYYAARARTGFAIPLSDVRIAAENGDEVPADGATMGELQVRGPCVAASYFKKEPDSDSFTSDGWLRTGDVATMDVEGYVKICDRTRDLIKSGGEFISSVELENAIMGHPAVAEAAVVAVPDPKWSERPCAFVVLKPGAVACAEDISRFIAPKFAKWWLPDKYVFVESIPKGSSGKCLKRVLREQAAGRVQSRTLTS
jgi:fatty-acyl-CoA synthase